MNNVHTDNIEQVHFASLLLEYLCIDILFFPDIDVILNYKYIVFKGQYNLK